MNVSKFSLFFLLILGSILIQCERSAPFDPGSAIPGSSNPSATEDQMSASVQDITASFNMGTQYAKEEPLDEISHLTITFADEPVTGSIYGLLNARLVTATPVSDSRGTIKQSGRGTLRLVSGRILSLSFKGSVNHSKLEGTMWGYNPEGNLVLLASYEESGPEESRRIVLTGKVYSDMLPVHQEVNPE